MTYEKVKKMHHKHLSNIIYKKKINILLKINYEGLVFDSEKKRSIKQI